uniref:mitochondrial carrier homolog 2-like n=1 Tax=Myxine glutinosa TaxID=7769 RepID=UPI00358F4AD0
MEPWALTAEADRFFAALDTQNRLEMPIVIASIAREGSSKTAKDWFACNIELDVTISDFYAEFSDVWKECNVFQVGYEPIAPVLGHNLFFRQELQLPGFFSYAKYIAKQDGQFGLFRGLTPRLCSALLALFTYHKVLKAYTEEEHLLEDEEEESTEEAFHPPVMQPKASKTMNDVIRETSHEMAAQCAATVISHPFHGKSFYKTLLILTFIGFFHLSKFILLFYFLAVITVRRMVQFIGKEIKYSGLFGSFGTIYREEGLKGFFVGLIPRVMGGIIFLWLCKLVTHIINTHVINNRHQYREMKSYTQAVTLVSTGMEHAKAPGMDYVVLIKARPEYAHNKTRIHEAQGREC